MSSGRLSHSIERQRPKDFQFPEICMLVHGNWQVGPKKMVQGHLLFDEEATAPGKQLRCALEASEVKLGSVSLVINPDDFIPNKDVI